MLKKLVAGLAVAAGLVWLWTKVPASAFYAPKGLTLAGRATTRVMAWWSGLGLPPHRQVVLEIRGRKSGVVRTLPVVVATVDGQRYLVSMLGERAAWVANARAGMPAWLRHGKRQPIRLEEYTGERSGAVLKEYVRLAPGARPFITLPLDAPESEFAEAAGAFPIFCIIPAGV